jgi:hypothetical protein
MKRPATRFRVYSFSDGWVACHPAIWKMHGPHVVTLVIPVRNSRWDFRAQDGKFGRTPFEALERMKRELAAQGLQP